MIEFNNNNNKYKYSSIIKKKNNLNVNSFTDVTNFKSFMTKIYSIMSLALLVTFLTSYLVVQNFFKLTNPIVLIQITGFSQILLVLYISYKLSKGIELKHGLVLLFIYSVAVGITLSILGLAYEPQMIFHALAITILFFIALCIVGYMTNYKLLSYGRMLFFALLFFLLVQIISSFLFPQMLHNPIIDFIGIIIFSFYTVYDYQSIRYAYNNISTKKELNTLIVGSVLMLYINFINLFLYILRLFSNKD